MAVATPDAFLDEVDGDFRRRRGSEDLIAYAPTDLALALDVIEAAKKVRHAVDTPASPVGVLAFARLDAALDDLRVSLDAFEAAP